MAVWVTALKLIPWKEVITHAPVVAEGARRLWNAVGKRSDVDERLAEAAQHDPSSAVLGQGGLEAHVAAMDAALSELREQMVVSSDLIKQLADQNTQLIRRIEANRVRVAWLSVATAAALIAAVAALVLR